MKVPWTVRRSNQSILKATDPEQSLEELMLKHQYFGYLKRRANSLEKTLTLGKIDGTRIRGWQRIRLLHSITNSINRSLSKLRETVEDRGAWPTAVRGATELDMT